jgi:CRP-like cAMP-binding protein
MADHQNEKIFWGLNFRWKKSAEISRQEFLKTVPLFESLNDKQLKILGQHLHERTYEENEYLFEINHPGTVLFLISRGEVIVETSSDPTGAVELARIKPKEFLGELALVDDSPRSASARAVRTTHTYALSRGELKQLGDVEPGIAREIYKAVAYVIGERLKASNRQSKKLKEVA